jgi:peptidyl-tRNA hydrolase
MASRKEHNGLKSIIEIVGLKKKYEKPYGVVWNNRKAETDK